MTTTLEPLEELEALKNYLDDKNLDNLTFEKFKKYLSNSFGNPSSVKISGDIVTYFHALVDCELLILESGKGNKFLGTLYKPKSGRPNSQISILTVVGTYTKSYHLFLNLFIDHKSILKQAKRIANRRFQDVFPLITERYGNGMLRPYSEPTDAPMPLLVQKFSKFLGIPYKVTYHAVYWKSRAILSV